MIFLFFLIPDLCWGAVRHNGFIPWDDDIDVGMTLSNYELFLQIAPKELGEDFFIDNYTCNKEYALVFTKIRLKNTLYIERVADARFKHNEVFVDIFPYFYVSNNAIIRKYEALQMSILSHAIMAKSGYKVWNGQGILKKMKFLPIMIIGKICTKNCMFSKIDKLLHKHKNTSLMCEHAGGSFYMRWIMPAEIFDSLIYASFEGLKYPILKEYDRYLKIAYGDYMKIPPEKERETHEITKLDLGLYHF